MNTGHLHPIGGDKCIFGHESKYLRRAKGHTDCFIGSAPLSEGYKLEKNCSCTRRDYECDYNYVRDVNDNTCKLVKGMTSADRKTTMCSKENAFQYFESTGYRKIPLSTCKGGQQFDNWNLNHVLVKKNNSTNIMVVKLKDINCFS